MQWSRNAYFYWISQKCSNFFLKVGKYEILQIFKKCQKNSRMNDKNGILQFYFWPTKLPFTTINITWRNILFSHKSFNCPMYHKSHTNPCDCPSCSRLWRFFFFCRYLGLASRCGLCLCCFPWRASCRTFRWFSWWWSCSFPRWWCLASRWSWPSARWRLTSWRPWSWPSEWCLPLQYCKKILKQLERCQNIWNTRKILVLVEKKKLYVFLGPNLQKKNNLNSGKTRQLSLQITWFN